MQNIKIALIYVQTRKILNAAENTIYEEKLSYFGQINNCFYYLLKIIQEF